MIEGSSVRHDLICKLVSTWPKRATVRSDKFPWPEAAYDPSRSDYPLRMVPFRDHPRFTAVAPAVRENVLTRAWLVYNERTILAEEYIANPAFTMIAHGAFEGASDPQLRQAVQHVLIDEHFHTLLHTLALNETRARRGIAVTDAPDSVTRRRFLGCLARTAEPWQRAIVTLAFAVVAEVSVNAYLELLSSDLTIQPLNRLVPYLHNRDEFAHGQLMVEATKLLYLHMDERRRRHFVTVLPEALMAYAAHDYTAWRTILTQSGVVHADEIVSDCEHDAASHLLIRDFSGLKRIADELEITGELDFRFEA